MEAHVLTIRLLSIMSRGDRLTDGGTVDTKMKPSTETDSFFFRFGDGCLFLFALIFGMVIVRSYLSRGGRDRALVRWRGGREVLVPISFTSGCRKGRGV